ncbi:fimbrial protein [Pantoea sp. CTOTU46764]|uniref:fimbrial protein n=1 Tax=Pantoea sp. CTOTU46764 TaxID=2953854 RepID=UPI0028A2D93A|nr:fimbrial protein [Pantoea sp. CTOTU46764]
MKKIYSAIAALTLLSVTSAASANTGTINLSGSVGDSTCTVTGLNQSLSFPHVSATDLQSLANYKVPVQAPVSIDVTACPSNFSKGVLTVNFPAESGSTNRLDLGNTTMRGAAVMIGREAGSDTNDTLLIHNGSNKEFEINGGAGNVTIYPSIVRVSSGATGGTEVVAGDFSTTAQLTMAFE